MSVAEDAGNPFGAVGSPVSSLIGGISDADGGALQGIAIVGSNLTHGSWYFTTDNGASWHLVAASPSSSLLLANDANTRLYFQPDANFNGTATAALTVRAWDQSSGTPGTWVNTVSNGGNTAFSSATDTIDVQVTAVNDAPIAFGAAALAPIAEDSTNPPGATVAALFGGAGNFHDNTDQVAGGSSANTFAGIAISQYNAIPAIGTWQYSTDGGASWIALGDATLASAVTLQGTDLLRFVPAANYNGDATQLRANLIESGVSITSGDVVNLVGATGGTTHYSQSTVLLSETVTPVDDPSVLVADSRTVAEDHPATGNVLTNDSDVDNALSVVSFSVGGTAYAVGAVATLTGVGTLTMATNGSYTFTPVANWNGTVPTVSYTTNTGGASTLDITVTPVDDAFADANETISVAEDTTLTGSVLTGTTSVDGPVTVSSFTVAGVAGSFTAGQAASIAGVGTLQINADGGYSFTPAANYNGAVPIATYTLSDGSSGDTSTLAVTVTPVNDAFSDADETVNIAEDTMLTGSVLSGTSSVDGLVTVSGFTVAGVAGSFTAGQAASIVGVGTLQINADGGYSFTPAANYNGAVPVVTYTLSDGSSGDTSTLAITVIPVVDAFDDANETVNIAEDTTLTGSVLSGTSSADGPVTVTGFTVAGIAGSFVAGQAASIAGVGTLQINADGSYSFTPAANYAGAVPVATYTLSDGSNGDTSTLSITVTSDNDAPTVGSAAISVSEEGVAGGIADTAGSPGDSTNLAIRSGTIGIADSDSPVTVSLQAPTAALSAGGVAITWSGADSQMLIGSAGGIEVARVTIDNSGNYQVTLSQVLDHGVAGSEDSLSFNVGVTASDGAMSASGAIALTVEDDSPLATSSAVAVGGTATNTNLAIVLDLSGSMDDPSGLTNATRLAVTKEAIKELIDTYDGMGEVMVNVTVFGSSGTSGTWMTAANALQFVTAAQSFSSSGTMYTNYDAALAAAMTAYGGAGKLSGANVQNVLYFLSDGEPNRGDGNNTALTNTNAGSSDNGIQGVEETIWTNFLSSNHVSAYAIGLGTGVTTANMDPVAYDGVNGTGRDSLSVADLNDLSSVLASTIESRVTGAIMIDGGGSGGFGADGGYLAALTYGNNTFSFDGSALTVGGAGTTAYSFDAASHVLAVTAAGGPFVVDMDTGEYTYTRTPSRTVLQESFGYTLTDHDGDTAVGTLTINLPDYDTAPVARDDRVVVASGSVSSNTVTLKDAWLTWNDSDAEAATLTVSAVSNATSHASSQVVDAVSASSGGSGAFSYTVSDGGQTNDAAVSITTVNSSTLSGTGLDNILVGDSTGETIRGYEGNDVLVGNAGNDTLSGGSGIDLLIGGTGNDSLSGGIGSDTFAWSLADQGTAATPARDTISDFSVAAKADGGDMLDLRDLLQGENHASGTGNLTDFLHFTRSGSDTVIDIKPTGTSGSVTQQIVMSGVDLTAGNTLNDQAIIQDLLTKGKLLTD
ncbi:beta strand repeat-containing protein [Dechloromonas sp. A34]|uniref:beta strand repeat-containing protein n=1 Tax=Dechloromonas sp. A34 TaxID=447588 RepID=UPI0022490199|nr:Ig-like domain-containing protein [Dechloromonas sp. A34]